MVYLLPVFECESILTKHRIDITPVRIDVLRIVHFLSCNPFTIQQVLDALESHGLARKRNTVEYTLRLFKARQILFPAAAAPVMRRGRKEIKMLYALMEMAGPR